MTTSSGYGGYLLQTYIILLGHLRSFSGNEEECTSVIKEYKPILKANQRKRNQVDKEIYPILKDVLDANTSDIKDKDFSFLGKSSTIILGANISEMVDRIWESDNDDSITNVVNELLYLFYQIMDQEDKKEIEDMYKTNKAPEPKMPDMGNLNMGKFMEKLLSKHKNTIKGAENNPALLNEAISEIIKDSTGDLVGMISNTIDAGKSSGK